MRFGGIVAVDDVDFHAEPGEVIGLIGTNGAGKSTLLNAIGGFVPSHGHGRAARTRRLAAPGAPPRPASASAARSRPRRSSPSSPCARPCSSRSRRAGATSFWGTLLWLPPATRRRAARSAPRPRSSSTSSASAATPTGSSPSCRPAPAASSSSPPCSRSRPACICLDEPTAGVAQREAEAFGPLIKRVQQELDATLVVVEHDLPLILSISDRVYCMEAGAVIAHGHPHEVRNDPLVVASYLGTDDRAIQRSNATS